MAMKFGILMVALLLRWTIKVRQGRVNVYILLNILLVKLLLNKKNY